MLEHDVQNLIRIWCGEHDVPCFRCNVGRVLCADGTWFGTGLPEGFSDLMLLWDRTVVFVEVKARRGRQREAQKDFEAMVTKRGYKYVVARSVEDVAEALGMR